MLSSYITVGLSRDQSINQHYVYHSVPQHEAQVQSIVKFLHFTVPAMMVTSKITKYVVT
jgi:hypothetical protein